MRMTCGRQATVFVVKAGKWRKVSENGAGSWPSVQAALIETLGLGKS